MNAGRETTGAETDSVNSKQGPLFWHETFRWCLLSLVLMWLAFPPAHWWLLAWIAPVGWIRVIRQPLLHGRRPIFALYVVGWLHWLSITYWVTYPHWGAAIGWLFLAAYLALFVVGFLLLARWLVHRNQISAVFAVPVAWVTMEILRTYLFSGFGLVPLSHSQVDFLPLIQIANLTGAYGVSFVVMLCAAALEDRISAHFWDLSQPKRWWPIAIASIVLAVSVAFGYGKLNQNTDPAGKARVAIIQGSLDTVFGDNYEQRKASFSEYSRMTFETTSSQKIDLVLWPESMFWKYFGITQYDPELASRQLGPEQLPLETWANIGATETARQLAQYRTKCLLGTSTTYYHESHLDRYNTAAYFDDRGQLIDTYHKMHPVMFGEYIPFGDVFPWLYNFAPIPNGLTSGKSPKAFAAGTLTFSPCICFENTVPQLVRRQVAELSDQDNEPHALVTLTNDGWFWGSACLDLHLACGIFRAVENRKPMLICANTGISAHIDHCGRVIQRTPKRKSRVIVADVAGQEVTSFYTLFGDVFGFGCVLLSAIGLVVGKFFS